MSGLFKDKDNNTSSIRVMMVGTVGVAWVVAILGVVLGRNLIEIAALVGALLLPAFGAKAYQAKAGA